MNILLTGGTGYIGSHTAVVLAAANHNVVLYDNLSNSSKLVVDKLKKIIGKQLEFVEGDVRDTQLLSQTLMRYQIDAVIHFVGLKAVGESVEKPLDYYDNNVNGTICLLKAMRETQIKTLIFSSSATVYGNPQYLPIDELHPTNAVNPYGRTKLQIEEILKDVAEADDSWRIASLRYFNPIGAHESGLICDDPNGIPNNLMPYIAQVAVGRLPYLNIFGDDYDTHDGTGVRDYIHVMDLAEGHVAALGYCKSKGASFIVFNLGTGQGYSVFDVVNAFKVASGKDVPYKITSRRAGDVAACYADVGKAWRELRWKACRGIDEMCASVWGFQVGAIASSSEFVL